MSSYICTCNIVKQLSLLYVIINLSFVHLRPRKDLLALMAGITMSTFFDVTTDDMKLCWLGVSDCRQYRISSDTKFELNDI